jgi:adenylylsulfate kinase-like enzyme
MTGIDDPYERPERADLVITPDDPAPVDRILGLLRERGIVT